MHNFCIFILTFFAPVWSFHRVFTCSWNVFMEHQSLILIWLGIPNLTERNRRCVCINYSKINKKCIPVFQNEIPFWNSDIHQYIIQHLRYTVRIRLHTVCDKQTLFKPSNIRLHERRYEETTYTVCEVCCVCNLFHTTVEGWVYTMVTREKNRRTIYQLLYGNHSIKWDCVWLSLHAEKEMRRGKLQFGNNDMYSDKRRFGICDRYKLGFVYCRARYVWHLLYILEGVQGQIMIGGYI